MRVEELFVIHEDNNLEVLQASAEVVWIHI